LPRDDGEQRRSPVLTEQEPRHAADADPPERRDPQGEHEAWVELLPGLLDDPGRDGVDHLAVEEHHLEEHDEELDQDDLDDELDLSLLDSVDESLDAGEADNAQEEMEEPEQHPG